MAKVYIAKRPYNTHVDNEGTSHGNCTVCTALREIRFYTQVDLIDDPHAADYIIAAESHDACCYQGIWNLFPDTRRIAFIEGYTREVDKKSVSYICKRRADPISAHPRIIKLKQEMNQGVAEACQRLGLPLLPADHCALCGRYEGERELQQAIIKASREAFRDNGFPDFYPEYGKNTCWDLRGILHQAEKSLAP